MQLLQNLHCRAELPLPTVYDNQVRHGPIVLQLHVLPSSVACTILPTAALDLVSRTRLCRLSAGSAKPPAQHLLVTGEIIWSLDTLDLKTPVLTVFRTSSLKDHHRTH